MNRIHDAIQSFNERKEEIEEYFQFLSSIMLTDNYSKLSVIVDSNPIEMSNDLAKILRANGFIILYNLIESTISKCIESIYFEIENNKHYEFDELLVDLKKEFLKNLDVSKIDFINNFDNINSDILKFYPLGRDLFSGNVDAREIKKQAAKIGFSSYTDEKLTKSGLNLKTVKDKRNDLAHGFISFRDCGREYSIDDILAFKEEVLEYLNQIIKNIYFFMHHERWVNGNKNRLKRNFYVK